MKTLDIVTFTLVIVGALNWGLVGLARVDLVATLFGLEFGEVSALTGIVYSLVGLSGIYQAVFFKTVQRRSGAPVLATR